MHLRLTIIIFGFSLLAACGSEEPTSPAITPDTQVATLISRLGENPNACSYNQNLNEVNWNALNKTRCNWLSDYGLFTQTTDLPWQSQSSGRLYALNSELFTDFAQKYRYIFIPDQTRAQYMQSTKIEYPTGTTMVKIFSYNEDILEIRLAIKREHGWIFLPYIWSEQHQDAFFSFEGITTTYQHEEFGSIRYNIPSHSQCQTCHKIQTQSGETQLTVIGPKPQNLNRNIATNQGFINQLEDWQQQNLLTHLPDTDTIDTAPNWQDESFSLKKRAKAYLDINCAHCHQPGGDADLSGLSLEYNRKNIDYSHGVCNSSHGWRGGGFDIWPSKGSVSSIPIRMRHSEAKDRMPPIGRSLVHEQAAKLIEEWIDSMPYQDCAP